MTYDEQLKDPRWLSLRQIVLERDWYMCQQCMKGKSSGSLQVHHKRYIDGKMAWEYDTKDLITLCRICHMEEHGLDTSAYYGFCRGQIRPVRTVRDVMIEIVQGMIKSMKS